jgi:hypothetical protein
MTKGVDPLTGMGCRFQDMTGSRNGRLTFLRFVGRTAHKHTMWEAACDCGNMTVTATPRKTKSCGCLQAEAAAAVQRAKALPKEVKRESVLANRSRQRQRRKTDPTRAMQARLSRLHRFAIAQVGAIKTSPTFETLGYTPEQFAAHIEKQFTKGMGWHNMSEWQIDHILPVSGASTIEDVVALNQLSNLRPMWAAENNKKKDARQTLI